MRARALYAMEKGPAKKALWRRIWTVEVEIIDCVRRDPDPAPALDLLNQYRGVRRLERCLRSRRPVLIVEESPNGRARLFDGPSGARLAALLGFSGVEHLRSVAEAVNLLSDDEAAGGTPRGLLASRAAALPAARRVVLACGRAAADAFGLRAVPYLSWREVGRAAVLVVPSDRCRWWNDPGNRALAERALGWLGRRLRAAPRLAVAPGVGDETDGGGAAVVAASPNEAIDGRGRVRSKGDMSRTIRTTVPEDVGDAIDRLCEEAGIAPAVWMRALAIREVRFLVRSPGGDVYGCTCGHRRSEHRRERDRDGEFYGACAECDGCEQYRQAPPPEKKAHEEKAS